MQVILPNELVNDIVLFRPFVPFAANPYIVMLKVYGQLRLQ